MQLSDEAKAALERLRAYANGERSGERFIAVSLLADQEMLVKVMRDDLFPVRVLNGLTIRYDDEITPERLIASGLTEVETQTYARRFYLQCHCYHLYEKESWWRWQGEDVSPDYQPRNMGEVWELQARCEQTKGGSM